MLGEDGNYTIKIQEKKFTNLYLVRAFSCKDQREFSEFRLVYRVGYGHRYLMTRLSLQVVYL
jgi:hypothetical protein